MSEIKEIVFGTKNPAKIEQVRGVLSPLGISVVGLGDFGKLILKIYSATTLELEKTQSV